MVIKANSHFFVFVCACVCVFVSFVETNEYNRHGFISAVAFDVPMMREVKRITSRVHAALPSDIRCLPWSACAPAEIRSAMKTHHVLAASASNV